MSPVHSTQNVREFSFEDTGDKARSIVGPFLYLPIKFCLSPVEVDPLIPVSTAYGSSLCLRFFWPLNCDTIPPHILVPHPRSCMDQVHTLNLPALSPMIAIIDVILLM